MGVTPPKICFKHPIDVVPANRKASPYAPMNSTQMPQSEFAVPPMQTPRDPSPSGSKLTFAQQLYASSLNNSLSPMINSQSVPTSQLPSIHIRNLPTPPPSNSPPPGTHPSAIFNSIPSTAPPFLNPYPTNTRTPTPTNNSHPQRHRASTMPQRSAYVNPSTAGSHPRHLVTMARPPDEQSSSLLSPLVLDPPAAVHSAPVPSPPPASSILFSQTTVTLPITPPLTVQSTHMKPPNNSSLFSVPSGSAYKPRSISPLDKVTGLADSVVSALQSVLLTPGTGVDQMSLQAVIQGRPDADYHRIINALIKLYHHQHQQFALMKLHMQQPPLPGIDYGALIVEVRKVQDQQIATAQPQQQQHALQSLQGRQQQPQTAAQQYQALIQQQYQQAEQAAIQQQQQQQTAQNQSLLQQQQGTQFAIQPYLEAYNVSTDDNGGHGLFENHPASGH